MTEDLSSVLFKLSRMERKFYDLETRLCACENRLKSLESENVRLMGNCGPSQEDWVAHQAGWTNEEMNRIKARDSACINQIDGHKFTD